MGLMSYIHKQLIKRGKLIDLLPEEVDLDGGGKIEREAARVEIASRTLEERKSQREVIAAVKRLKELDKRNHYGESLRRAFGGK